jgi:hypothetical protein
VVIEHLDKILVQQVQVNFMRVVADVNHKSPFCVEEVDFLVQGQFSEFFSTHVVSPIKAVSAQHNIPGNRFLRLPDFSELLSMLFPVLEKQPSAIGFWQFIVKNALTQRLFSLEGRKIRRAKLSSKEF